MGSACSDAFDSWPTAEEETAAAAACMGKGRSFGAWGENHSALTSSAARSSLHVSAVDLPGSHSSPPASRGGTSRRKRSHHPRTPPPALTAAAAAARYQAAAAAAAAAKSARSPSRGRRDRRERERAAAAAAAAATAASATGAGASTATAAVAAAAAAVAAVAVVGAHSHHAHTHVRSGSSGSALTPMSSVGSFWANSTSPPPHRAASRSPGRGRENACGAGAVSSGVPTSNSSSSASSASLPSRTLVVGGGGGAGSSTCGTPVAGSRTPLGVGLSSSASSTPAVLVSPTAFVPDVSRILTDTSFQPVGGGAGAGRTLRPRRGSLTSTLERPGLLQPQALHRSSASASASPGATTLATTVPPQATMELNSAMAIHAAIAASAVPVAPLSVTPSLSVAVSAANTAASTPAFAAVPQSPMASRRVAGLTPLALPTLVTSSSSSYGGGGSAGVGGGGAVPPGLSSAPSASSFALPSATNSPGVSPTAAAAAASAAAQGGGGGGVPFPRLTNPQLRNHRHSMPLGHSLAGGVGANGAASSSNSSSGTNSTGQNSGVNSGGNSAAVMVGSSAGSSSPYLRASTPTQHLNQGHNQSQAQMQQHMQQQMLLNRSLAGTGSLLPQSAYQQHTTPPPLPLQQQQWPLTPTRLVRATSVDVLGPGGGAGVHFSPKHVGMSGHDVGHPGSASPPQVGRRRTNTLLPSASPSHGSRRATPTGAAMVAADGADEANGGAALGALALPPPALGASSPPRPFSPPVLPAGGLAGTMSGMMLPLNTAAMPAPPSSGGFKRSSRRYSSNVNLATTLERALSTAAAAAAANGAGASAIAPASSASSAVGIGGGHGKSLLAHSTSFTAATPASNQGASTTSQSHQLLPHPQQHTRNSSLLGFSKAELQQQHVRSASSGSSALTMSDLSRAVSTCTTEAAETMPTTPLMHTLSVACGGGGGGVSSTTASVAGSARATMLGLNHLDNVDSMSCGSHFSSNCNSAVGSAAGPQSIGVSLPSSGSSATGSSWLRSLPLRDAPAAAMYRVAPPLASSGVPPRVATVSPPPFDPTAGSTSGHHGHGHGHTLSASSTTLPPLQTSTPSPSGSEHARMLSPSSGSKMDSSSAALPSTGMLPAATTPEREQRSQVQDKLLLAAARS